MWSWLPAVLTAVAAPFTSWMDRKKVVAEAHAKADVAQAEAKAAVFQKVAEGTISWEQAAVEGKKDSWVDEFITVAVFAPYIFSFMPWLQPYAWGAIRFVSQAPQWYQTLFMVVSGAGVGVKFGPKIIDLFRK